MDRKRFKFGPGNTGVWITKEDIDLLWFIWQHRVLSVKELKFYCNQLFGHKPDTVARKLRRWKEEKVVVVKKHGSHYRNYRLGKNGYSILQQEKNIGSSEIPAEEFTVGKKIDHFFGTRDVVVRTLVKVKQINVNVFTLSPFTIPYLNEDGSTLIRPDWILSNEKGVINIELDTSSEGHAVLSEKVLNYIKYVSKRPSENHNVLIALVDNSNSYFTYLGDYEVNRLARVANIKDTVIRTNAIIQPNLNLYVVPINRAHEVATNLLIGDYPYTKSFHSSEIEDILKGLAENKTFNFDVELMNANEFYLPEVERTLYADGHLLLSEKDSDNTKVVLVKFMEEGSAKCLDGLRYLNTLKLESRYKRKVDKIIAIYRSTSEFESDALGSQVFQHVIFGIKELIVANEEQSPFFKDIKHFKKGEGTLL